MRRVLPPLFLGIGLLLLAGAGYAAWREIEFRRGAVETDGVVVGLAERTSHDRDGRTSRTYAPIFTFALPDGSRRRAESGVSSNPPCCAVGERIRVRYRPEAPERAYRVGFLESWLLATMLGGVGLVLAGTGIATAILLRRGVAVVAGAPPGWTPGPMAPPGMVTVAAPLVGLRREPGAWILQAGWTDPRNGARRLFESPALPFDPVPQMRHMTSVNVTFDPDLPNGAHAMDLSFLRAPG